MWLGFLLLVCVGAFIVWDSRRLRGEPSKAIAREEMKKGFVPRGTVLWQVHLGFGGMCAVAAFMEWNSPSIPQFTGRWSWLHRFVFDAAGPHGLLGTWLLVAAAFLTYGVVLLRRERRGGGR